MEELYGICGKGVRYFILFQNVGADNSKTKSTTVLLL